MELHDVDEEYRDMYKKHWKTVSSQKIGMIKDIIHFPIYRMDDNEIIKVLNNVREKYSSIHNSSTTQNLKKSCKKWRALFEIIQNLLISVTPKNFGDFGRFAENNTKMNEKRTDYFLCLQQKN